MFHEFFKVLAVQWTFFMNDVCDEGLKDLNFCDAS